MHVKKLLPALDRIAPGCRAVINGHRVKREKSAPLRWYNEVAAKDEYEYRVDVSNYVPRTREQAAYDCISPGPWESWKTRKR